FHRVESERDLIAGFERRASPSLTRQRVGTTSLEAPLSGRPVLLRDDLNPDVWVRPLQLLDGAFDLEDLLTIEHRARMMRRHRGSGEHARNRTYQCDAVGFHVDLFSSI